MGSMSVPEQPSSMSSTTQIPNDMTPPKPVAPKPWIEIPTGNITRKSKKGSRDAMVANTGGSGTNVPAS